MAEVKIQRLIRREGRFVVVECQIGLGTPCSENMVLYAREEFLHVTNADCFAGRRLKIIISRE